MGIADFYLYGGKSGGGGGSSTLAGLTDVEITDPTSGESLKYDGSKWVNGNVTAELPDFIEETSGNIVTVNAAERPAKSLKVAIAPVQSGSGDPSPDNIRPISGWTGATVTRCGVNVWDEEWEVGGLSTTTGAVESDTVKIRSKNFCACKPGTIYLKVCVNPATYVWFYDIEKNFISFTTNATTFTTPDNCYYFKLRIGDMSHQQTAYNHDVSINYSSTDTQYHPGQVEQIEIEFPSEVGTVYGGTLDVTSGTLTVTKANIASYDGETLPGAWISDRDVYAEGTTPTTGAQVVYDLATPITYQLTPTEVQMLLGTNNIWADTGEILEGKYWGKKSSATRQMLNTLHGARENTEITPEEPEEPEENDER